ncbi:MAG: hypothetical protein L0229_20120 [Blastocatellia bacterium]|nr:hypothetical protein [Blastocatellia bacterium]
MNNDVFDKLITFLSDLERRGISYSLAHNRDEAIMVMAAVPGERWEIEFLDDGLVEVERFISDGQICGEEILNELFARYSEDKSDDSESPQEAEAITVGSE